MTRMGSDPIRVIWTKFEIVNYTAIGRLRRAFGMVVAVFAIGTIGYWLFGLSPTDAVYQTVTTVTTVGFREVHES